MWRSRSADFNSSFFVVLVEMARNVIEQALIDITFREVDLFGKMTRRDSGKSGQMSF